MPFTMTSVERLYGLYRAIDYIEKNKIEGDVVEAGVWKGGSSMMAALALKQAGNTGRKIWMYDTYEGMSEPTEKDISWKNEKVKENWEEIKSTNDHIMCISSLDEVQQNVFSTKYPQGNLLFVKGKVEETIPQQMPSRIALLRLDTDWYESTYHELKHLFPLLAENGVLIIDDYGYWKGAREAVDQYFQEQGIKPLLHRLDHTGRMMIKLKK